jgi:hypothetical protein
MGETKVKDFDALLAKRKSKWEFGLTKTYVLEMDCAPR